MSLSPETVFGHYKIISKLGAGGMGEVFLAEDTRLERCVAIKILPEKFSIDVEGLNRFKQEAKAASALNHPNIITVYEIGEYDRTNFIAAEFIDGKTLRERLDEGNLALDEVFAIVIQTAEALAAAHSVGVVHRDVKPENIMIRPDGYVKILDFGLAKLTQQSSNEADAEDATRKFVKTNPGVVMGTVNYMSPEQARGLDVDARSDVFSFGIVLYEMVARRKPFEGETISDVIAAILTKEPTPLNNFAPDVPKELQRIVGKTLRKKREQRYDSTKDLLNDLKDLREEVFLESKREQSIAPNKSDSFQNSNVGLSSGQNQTSSNFSNTSSGGAKEPLLLTEFANLTGDAVFDGTLKMALAVTLEQSPFLNIFADTRVRETLRLMGRSPDETVTRELGREICQRHGLKVYIAGTIANFGASYVLTLEAVNAQTGESLGRQLEQTELKEQVLKALGQAASGLRERLGESLSSLEKFDAPLEEATTSSLEALKCLSLGEEQAQNGKHLESISFYKRAVELDPNFAYAYCRLGVQYYNTNQPGLAADNITEAFAIKDAASEIEKLRITFFYYGFVTGESGKAIETAELYKKTYPRDWRASNYLADRFWVIGQFEKAVAAARDALRLNPNAAVAFINLIGSLVQLNLFAEAKEDCEQAFKREINGGEFHGYLYRIAFAESDTEATVKHLAWFNGQPDEYAALNLQTGTAAFKGQWRKSQDFARRAIDLAARGAASGVAAQYAAEQALRIVFWSSGAGLPSAGDNRLKSVLKTQTNNALRLERNRLTLSRAALALAVAGHETEAKALTVELSEKYPSDTLVNNLWLPTIRAAVELQNGKPKEAIEELETAERFEKVSEFHAQYIRALAYLNANKSKQAINEFEKILRHRGEAVLSALYPLAQLGLARARKDKREYEKFFELWNEADKDMPALVAAQKEYNNLKG